MTVPIGRSSTAAISAKVSISAAQDLARLGEQCLRRRDQAAPVARQCALFGIGAVGSALFDGFQRHLLRALACQDRSRCCARCATARAAPLAAKGVEITGALQHGLLREILRLDGIARQPAREAAGSIEMRQHEDAKSLDRAAVRLRRIRHAAHGTSIPSDRRFYSMPTNCQVTARRRRYLHEVHHGRPSSCCNRIVANSRSLPAWQASPSPPGCSGASTPAQAADFHFVQFLKHVGPTAVLQIGRRAYACQGRGDREQPVPPTRLHRLHRRSHAHHRRSQAATRAHEALPRDRLTSP